MQFFKEVIEPNFNYWVYVVLMMIGLWAVIAKNNLIKKLIGLSIFQTAIILFYVSIGVKGPDSKIPITPKPEKAAEQKVAALMEETIGEYAPSGDAGKYRIEPDNFANPLPHVLMLTAIVVGVATLGVALAVAQQLFKDYGTLEEDEILEQIKKADSASPDA